jgi:hypothetical protein
VDVIHETELESGFSIDHVAGEHDFHCTAFADETRQTLRPATAGHDPEIDLRL